MAYTKQDAMRFPELAPTNDYQFYAKATLARLGIEALQEQIRGIERQQAHCSDPERNANLAFELRVAEIYLRRWQN